MQSLETLGRLKVAAAQRPRQGAFWRAELADLPERTGFPPDAPGRAPAAGPHTTTVLALGDELTAGLRTLTRGRPLALHTVLVAAVAALLQRYTGGEEAVLAVPATALDAQTPALAEGLVLRLPLTPDSTFRTVLATAKDRLLAALEHRDFPVEILAAQFGVAADRGRHPFADVLVDVVREEGEARTERPLFALAFAFVRGEGGLRLELRHRTAQHGAATAERLLGHCAALLAAAVAAPDDQAAALDLRTDADRAVIERANDTGAPFESTVRLDELFARQARRTPHATAVVGDGFRLTYAELDERANRLARTLRERGVGRDDLVAVLADRSPLMLVAIHAVLKSGGAYLPVDPGYPAERVRYVLDDSAARVVLTTPGHRDLIPGDRDVIDLTDASAYAEDATAPQVLGDARDLAYVIYTSGSTGAPKGVQIEHRSVVNRITWMQRAYPITAADVIMQKTPTSFDVSVWELFWWMFEGAAVCLPAPGAERDPEALVAAIERHGVTTVHFVPTMLGAFLDFVAGAGDGPRLARLRQVFASGEALTAHHVRRFAEVAAAGPAPAARLINLYGPTEATIDVTHHACGPADTTRVPIGRPIDNTRVHILDAAGRPQPIGVPGELCVAGAGLARGYLGRPDLTAERFVAAPAAGEERVYRTGDLARRLPDGDIDYLGRIDHQVKVRGYRIELGEIEETLRRHPQVKDALVLARTAEDGQTHLYGYVSSADAPTLAGDDLRAHLRLTLPDYMVPARLMALDAFPLTANGKLDRRALPEPAPPQSRGAAYTAPGTPQEAELARIWGEVLGRERIGVDDNFFALGGNSIHFVTVLAKARAAGLDFTFQQFFQNPTVARLARSLTGSRPGGRPGEQPTAPHPFELLTPQDRALIPAGVEDAYPMTQLQAGLVFQSELSHGTAEYHDILSYMIQSSFDAACFEEAVRILVRRNPVFRTAYHLTGYSEYLQLVYEDAPLPLFIDDLRGMDETEQERWYRDWAVREKAYRFSWTEPGLVRLHVHVLSDDLFRYSLSQHNSALDGWSITLVHTTLFDLFHRLRDGRDLPDGAVDNHARTYVALERAALADEGQRAFWAGVLEGSAFAALPRTRQEAEAEVFPVVFHEVELPRGLSERITALADRLAVPVKNVLMAAHVKVLSLVSGERDVMTGYEHSGRPEAEDATRAIGLFLNTVPFRVDTAEGTWEDLIRQVYRRESDLLPARRYPMAQMKRDLGTQRELFETAFNFTHFYLLKQLEARDGFSLLDVRANSETEFVLRAEFSQHFVTDEVRLSLHYHAHLFEPWQIDRMGACYAAAFEQMTADPGAPHHLANLLGADELAELEAAERAEALPPELAALVPPHEAAARARVVDEHGLAVPLATVGRVVLVAEGRAPVDTGRYGRRDRDGLRLLTGERERRVFHAGRADAAEQQPTDRRPVDEVDLRIARVWAEVLGTPAEEIRLDDNFFLLGGASLAAMRAVMELDGLVSLTDLMRNSTLAALGEVARRNLAAADTAGPAGTAEHSPRELLVSACADPDAASCVLVCFPYAGGNAINFEPLGRALDAAGGAVAVYGVELPGHDAGRPDEAFWSLEDTARQVAQETRSLAAGRPVMLWGHCVGSALAVETARLLEAGGTIPAEIFVSGKLLRDAVSARQGIEQAAAMADEDIVRWLVEETGFAEFDRLRPDHAAFVARVFRHDAGTANGYLLSAVEHGPRARLRAPLTTVFAADDPLTPGHAEHWTAWSLFADAPRLAELPDGGHYFCRTKAPEVADLILGRRHTAAARG